MVSVRTVAKAIVGAVERGQHGKRYPIGDVNMTHKEMFEIMMEGYGIQKRMVNMPKYLLAIAGKALGWDLPDVHSPEGFFSLPPSIRPIMFQFRFAEVFTLGFLPILLTVFLMDFVDTMGTLIGVSARAGFLDDDGNLKDIEKPMMADAVATVIGACAGTTTTGSYIESAAGIEEGGSGGHLPAGGGSFRPGQKP